jgi:hypothetical protein
MSKTQYSVLAIVLVIVATYGIFLYVSGPLPDNPTKATQEGDQPLTIKEESPPTSSNEPATSPIISVAKVERDIREVIALKDVAGSNSEAEAVLSLQKGQLTISLRASNLADPGNSRYAGWLYKDGGSKPLLIGPLSKIASGEYKNSYVLGFQGGSELQSYKIVVVTREATFEDQVPEKRILEGRFK